jgi:ubiquinone/menaquinone biosynthesis C-methylase UbiE
MHSPIETYFEQTAPYWDEVYDQSDVLGATYRRRLEVTISWIDSLDLAPGSRVLEIGCGTGLTAVALARRGFHVDATDSVAGMLERTRRRAAEAGVADRLRTFVADAESLDLEDQSFDLALAVGVAPWVRSPLRMVQEMQRVLVAGGYLLITADNRMRLTHLLDPVCNPALAPVVGPLGRLLVRLRLRRLTDHPPRAAMHRPAEVDGWLRAAGFTKVSGSTLGFGPFTLLGNPVLPARAALRLHRTLDGLADRGLPGLRAAGTQYVVLARKER